MNSDLLDYIQEFMDRIAFPAEARKEIMEVEGRITSDKNIADAFTETKTKLMNNNISINEALEIIGVFSKKLGASEYTLHFVFLINCTDILLSRYRKKNINEKIFWDTMDDFRCKLLECHEVMGVWGTFVPWWFDGFLSMQRFALGRFQYEEAVFESDTYIRNGIVLNKGDKVYSFHIPSSGQPFDKPARIESYRKAYDFYGFGEKGGIMVLVCNSWLLYSEFENILHKNSNILDFIHDFDIISTTVSEKFEDSWRVFGKYHTLPLQQLPTDTSLRKAIVSHLTAGGKLGSGIGVIMFDGDKITK